jgi:hypothetical protein
MVRGYHFTVDARRRPPMAGVSDTERTGRCPRTAVTPSCVSSGCA